MQSRYLAKGEFAEALTDGLSSDYVDEGREGFDSYSVIDDVSYSDTTDFLYYTVAKAQPFYVSADRDVVDDYRFDKGESVTGYIYDP